MTPKLQQQLLSGIPVHIDSLPIHYVRKLIEQISFLGDDLKFDIISTHETGCPAIGNGLTGCTCKEVGLEITREAQA